MLESLTIRKIALIDDVTIHFHNGMQVMTGETGAGKSIVVDSVNLILGGRAEREMIRSGYDKASVEAVFNVSENSSIKQFMEQEEINRRQKHVPYMRRPYSCLKTEGTCCYADGYSRSE